MIATPPPPSSTARIHHLARRLDTDVKQRWHSLLERQRDRLDRIFARKPEEAGEIYLRHLFRSCAWRLAQEGLEVFPRLPGGDPDLRYGDGSESSRTQWSVAAVCSPLGVPLGTLVTTTVFELSRFDVCRRPMVFGLECVGIESVKRALCGPSGSSRLQRQPWYNPAAACYQERSRVRVSASEAVSHAGLLHVGPATADKR